MTTEMAAGAPLVLDLLTYIEQVEKLKIKPGFSIPHEFFVAHQHELAGLPELQFNMQIECEFVFGVDLDGVVADFNPIETDPTMVTFAHG